MNLPDCDPETRKQAARWSRRYILLSIGVALLIVAAAWVGRQLPLRSPARIAVALVQGVASAALVVAIVRPIRFYDELQRRIQLEALAFAFAGTAIVGSTYGFLIKAGLPQIDWGAWIWPGMVVLWVIGLVIATRRYR